MKIVLALVWCGFATAAMPAADKYTVKHEQTEPPKELNDAVRELFAKECEVVKDAAGGTVAEIWFRTEIPGKGTPDQVKNGLTYRELVETSIVAAVRFPTAFIDYRKQEIAAGVYTLRLAFQPENGDHKDTAPYAEFALLCPADKDTKTDEMEPKALYKLSFASAGGEHPGVMLLYPNSEKGDGPKLTDRGAGVWTLNVRRKVTAEVGTANLGFALTVAGHSKLR
ncbi:hypothetical protein [Limnoglobus roseus]|uniref:Uncharacterized protein n=1 Tax=Limnoglobus roseus TaxID=2598579 RepID=A0A5C1AQQ6_9BACT|nr:hypothetical protein [Limnoglobus roseus]QEL19524.1 hypothetical protein PX52LOC_06599 [Limnoglobus roseus]